MRLIQPILTDNVFRITVLGVQLMFQGAWMSLLLLVHMPTRYLFLVPIFTSGLSHGVGPGTSRGS